MEISQILTLDCAACSVKGSSKKRILETISELAAHKVQSISSDAIFTSLINREKVGSTGIGKGIAIPHGRLANLDRVYGFLITCHPAIEYDSIDEKPVDVLFTLLVPEHQADGHLQTLATIASKLSNKHVLKSLRQANSSQQLFEAML
jgi:PTS system nitrogen regulatory IIA component